MEGRKKGRECGRDRSPTIFGLKVLVTGTSAAGPYILRKTGLKGLLFGPMYYFVCNEILVLTSVHNEIY